MISNQFWKHKDHVTALHGFAGFIRNGGDALLVCTGDVKDYRFPGYFEELKKLISELGISERVRILGHIPKIDQINLVKTTLAMVQPTLFEGGPGGGATYDAIALGVPVIASDIPVNKEINTGDVSYFVTKDADSLTKALVARGVNRRLRPSNDKLLLDGLARKNICGQTILNIVKLASLKDF
jgi:glycosyltransferase involved in cell wall biosynthesis